jgi:hypothetical protein
LAAEALVRYRSKIGVTKVIVEAEDMEMWDDIVRMVDSEKHAHRYQVKRQLTPLDGEDFGEYIKAAAKADRTTHFHFCVPATVDVKGSGPLRILYEICRRVQQDGADKGKVIANLTAGERAWVESIAKWVGADDADTLEFLRRFHVRKIGMEEDIDDNALSI